METRTDNPITTTSDITTTELPLVPGTWALDKSHARVGFTVRHLGLAKVRGHFADVDAELVVGSSLDETRVTATIHTGSIDTTDAARDASVRSPDVLDVDRRPTITFRSTGIRPVGEGWILDGDLTIGDVTRSVPLEVELAGVAEVYGGGRHAGFEARGELRRKDFGLSFGPADLAIGQVIVLELDLEFVEPT